MVMITIIKPNENNKTRMEKTEQLKSILTDLDNRELTKHQAHDLICVLFSVVVPKGTLTMCHARTGKECIKPTSCQAFGCNKQM